MFRRFSRFIVGLFAFFGFSFCVMFVLLVIGLTSLGPKVPPVPDKTILHLRLHKAVAEGEAANPLEKLTGPKVSGMRKLLSGLEAGARDPRVQALLIEWEAAPLSLPQIQEIRDAVKAFAAADKKTTFYAASIDTPSAYYLATSFDEIWIQPSGMLGLTGLALEMPFAKEGLASLGIHFESSKRKEYKSGFDNFTEEGMTAANREAMEAIVISWFSQILAGVSEGRDLAPEMVRQKVDKGPFPASLALDEKLIDAVGYRDDVQAHVLTEETDEEFYELYDFDDYLKTPEDISDKEQHRVALIYAVGQIVDGHVDNSPFGPGSELVGAMDIVDALEEAAEDPSIEGILIRIDSPGGSYVGSDAMYHAVKKARKKGKKIVASMASVAASGGYFLAMGADVIVSQPSSLTGSIGVLAGKPVFEDMWRTIGVSWDRVQAGNNGGMWSPHRSFSDEEWSKLGQMLDRIYDDFVAKAAEARSMTVDAMDAVARGRVWTGAEARRKGLVDQLGGLEIAKAEMRRLLALGPEEGLSLEVMQKQGSPFDFLGGDFGSQALVQLASWMMPEQGLQAVMAKSLYGAPLLGPLAQNQGIGAALTPLLQMERVLQYSHRPAAMAGPLPQLP